jgi:hypothetical protein
MEESAMKSKTAAVLGVLLVPLATLAFTGTASAVTINSTTPTWSNLVGGSGTSINVTNGNFLDVRWGVPAGNTPNSGLGFDPFAPPAVNEPINSPFLLGTLQHYNNSINGGTASSSVDLNLLTNVAGATPISQTFAFRFLIDETPNVAGTCVFPSVTPCADQITFQNLDTTSAFNIGGVNYTVALSGFSTDNGSHFTSNFISQEGMTNQAGLYAVITEATRVPEPISIALLGVGLLGVGFTRRLRSRS